MSRYQRRVCNPPEGCFECVYPECINRGRASPEEAAFDTWWVASLRRANAKTAAMDRVQKKKGATTG
jgi:hypothetical protein